MRRYIHFGYAHSSHTAYTHPFSSVEPTLTGDPIPATTHSRRRCRSDDSNLVSNRYRFCLGGSLANQSRHILLLHLTEPVAPADPLYSTPQTEPIGLPSFYLPSLRKPEGMTFDSEQCAYDFYNTYGGRMGFSIRRDYCRKNKFTNQLICRLLVCNKKGFRKVDKRDPLAKNPRVETRIGCEARLYIKLDESIGKFVVTNFKEKHNHDLVSPECAHMLPSQRKISTTQAIELDLAAQSGLRLG
ncbi:hypothetical protein ACSBR2_038049 [Camellia fascicularis]